MKVQMANIQALQATRWLSPSASSSTEAAIDNPLMNGHWTSNFIEFSCILTYYYFFEFLDQN
jgi:hypothetical protein